MIPASTNDQPTLGNLIRRVRLKNGWTLRQMGDKVGIPRSTLAKVEHDRLTLTYDKLQQMTARLAISMSELLDQSNPQSPSPSPSSSRIQSLPQTQPQNLAPIPTAGVVTVRRSLSARAGNAPISAPHADYEFLCTDLRDKRMVPILARIRARDIAEFGTPRSHSGEEFIFVLEGSIEVHTQFYEPFILKSGQGMYLDGTMAHAYVAKDCDSAAVLIVCSGAAPNLIGELLRSAVAATPLSGIPPSLRSLEP